MADQDKPLEFDQVTLICNGCKKQHDLWPDRPLRASELKGFLDTKIVKFCDCPSRTCDVKLRIRCPKCPHPTHKEPCKSCGCTHVFEAGS